MPLDPTISLHAGQGIAPMQGPNLGMLGQFAVIQNQLNQNRLFQQTFAARMRMGEIMASSPNLDSAMQTALQDPIAAPFAPQILNTVRQTELTMLQMQGEQQKQAQSGMEAVFKVLPAIYNNPTNNQWQTSMSAALAPLSQTAQQRVAPAIESIRMGLLDGISPDQEQAAAQIRQRVGALMLQGNMTPDSIRAVTGVPAPQPVQGPFGAGGATKLTTFGGPAVPLAGAGPAGVGALGGENTGGVAGAGSVPGAGLVGPSLMNQKYLAQRGSDMAAYQQRLDNNVTIGNTIMQTLDEAKDALANIKPGGGAEFYTKLAGLAQAVGVNQNLVDAIGNGNYAASQEFKKLMVNTTLGQIREQIPQGSRLAQMEFKAFNESNPNIETDPRAINKIFDFWTKVHERNVTEQSSMNDFLEKGGDISAWPAQWQKISAQKGYVLPAVGPAGEALPPPSGGAGPIPTFSYQGGKLVPVQKGQ